MSRRLSPPARPWSVGALVRHGARGFRAARLAYGHGTTNAQDEAAWLVLHPLGLTPAAPASVFNRPVKPRAAARVLALLQRRIRERKPAAYLTGIAWLGDHSFHIDERAIVPRSHIAGPLREKLAPWIARPQAVKTALDLCTGAGCLAVLMAHSFPGARIDAADISPAALAVARINVGKYRLRSRIRLIKSDMFSALGGKHYDLIICNPPYVTARNMRRLPREYRHEPRAALAGGKDGLDVVRRIVDTARGHLRPHGVLVVEVGAGRNAVERAYPRLPFTWLDADGGGDVFLLTREQLEALAQAPESRAR